MFRQNPIGWEWEVYVEMFVAGIAAGAYLTAMILELMGRGRSPIARTAHIIALPLILLAAFLLTIKLERSERFWHMVIQSNNIPTPMFKWWAPISLGTWGLMIFSFFAVGSFVDALIDRGWFKLGPWRRDLTLHGSILGKLWALGGILVALFIGAYSGMLLSVTAVPGWVDTVFIGPFFLAISGATGTAMLLLIEAVRRKAPLDEVAGLEQAHMLMLGWQLVLTIVFVLSLGGALTFFLTSARTIIASVVGVLLGVVAFLLLFFKPFGSGALRHAVVASVVLVSGFLLRYAVVMGPQHAIE